MSGKKEQKSNGSKKSDKMIDPHREYLDMDTDEEEFGRQGKVIICSYELNLFKKKKKKLNYIYFKIFRMISRK